MNVFSVLLLFLGNICVTVSFKLSSKYPGTKWCGSGNKAADYDDLGKYDKPDKCCRAHDKCHISLKARKSGWGLKNFWLPFQTRSACTCDNDFRKCLTSVSGRQKKHAVIIGIIYFQFLHPLCIKPYHPKKCTKKLWKICYKWGTDKSKTKYKWHFGKHWFWFLNGK